MYVYMTVRKNGQEKIIVLISVPQRHCPYHSSAVVYQVLTTRKRRFFFAKRSKARVAGELFDEQSTTTQARLKKKPYAR